ncbi:MAG: N-acetyltransferase, partial [Gammaproteobacteria bacterium]|nr:N-acetyltransferase [Gammaproteobacteria bacterium]
MAASGCEFEGRMAVRRTQKQTGLSDRLLPSAILAPLAVHPDHQGRGIGGSLVREGLARLKGAGVELVFVLGYPAYYAKLGLSPAGEKGFEAPHPIPPESADAWMVQAL